MAIGLLWSASGRWGERGWDISALREAGMVLVKESEIMALPIRYVDGDPKKEALLN